MSERKKLGEIFVEQDILCLKTVERVLAISQKTNKRFGAVLEEIGLITGEELAKALALQHQCKTVFNFAKAHFPPQVLDIITADTALQNLIFPLKVENKSLHMAVSDPTDTKIRHNIAINNGLSVIPYVSTRSEINVAVCKHYFGINVTEPVRKTVLVVEDDKMVLALLRNILSSQYQIITAENGIDAFRETVGRKPHVILTDKEMPKLDGFGLLGALRGIPETKSIPVILISGTTSADAEARAFEKGFFDFIPKPIKEATILTRVKRAFEFYEQHNYIFMKPTEP